MAKHVMGLLERRRTAHAIFEAMLRRDGFLLLGHHNPDDDCVAAVVAVALLLKKLHKQVLVGFGEVHEHLSYLLSICRYNAIGLVEGDAPPPDLGHLEAVVICDTPKPSMIETRPWMAPLLQDPSVVKIEFDHHIGADSEYCGDRGYRMVTEASSSCELVGRLALQLRRRSDLMTRYQMAEPFSRNFVLAVLTGIIGDSKMGRFLKSPRERRYYRRFSRMFNRLLATQTVRESNLADMEQIFGELQKLSASEQQCFEVFMKHRRRSGSTAYVALGEGELRDLGFDNNTVVSAARAVADVLAEESGRLGLVAYYDDLGQSDLVQFRLRRSKDYKLYDLREVLDRLDIRDGGGHEGAIGFRFPRDEVQDLDAKVAELVEAIEAGLPLREPR